MKKKKKRKKRKKKKKIKKKKKNNEENNLNQNKEKNENFIEIQNDPLKKNEEIINEPEKEVIEEIKEEEKEQLLEEKIKEPLVINEQPIKEKEQEIENKNLFQRVQGVILMYDITKRETFERLDLWLNLIKQMTNDIPIVLVGNKLDQEDNIENGRIVEYSEGEDFARDNDFEFFEASAMDGTNIDKVFSSIAEKIIKNLQDDRMPSMVKVVADNKNVKKKKKCC